MSGRNQMNNTKIQNPCLVAAYLMAACNGGRKLSSLLHRSFGSTADFFFAEYSIDPLAINYHYAGPIGSEANICQCSTVTYSLVSACGDCQNRTYEA
jgi:hypothetical protein